MNLPIDGILAMLQGYYRVEPAWLYHLWVVVAKIGEWDWAVPGAVCARKSGRSRDPKEMGLKYPVGFTWPKGRAGRPALSRSTCSQAMNIGIRHFAFAPIDKVIPGT